MAAWLQKYWLLTAALLCTLMSVIFSDVVFNYDIAEEVQQINAAFQKKELTLTQELRSFQNSFNKNNTAEKKKQLTKRLAFPLPRRHLDLLEYHLLLYFICQSFRL
jgi:hypothetical protein